MYPWNVMFACTIGISLVFMLQTKGSCNSLFGCVFKNEKKIKNPCKIVVVGNNMFFFCHCGSCGHCTVIKPRVQENRQHTQPPSLWSFGEKWPQAFCIFLRKRRRWVVLRVWLHGQELETLRGFTVLGSKIPFLSIIKMRWKLLSWNVSFTLTDNHILWSVLVVFHLSHEHIGQ